MHNIITLRGALVRDSKAWSQGLDESLVLFGDRAAVLFAGHHWPTWGQRDIARLLVEQRDMYAFMHDQTVRLMNEGLTGVEIAEKLSLPPTLDKAWHIQGYYGSFSHNIKAIYQRYMTWFDGNPVNLWRHTPTEEGKRYVACMGGADRTVALGIEYAAKGDLRFAATLLGHVVAAEPKHPHGRESLSAVFTKLGHGSVNATWRNFYLTGAMDLQRETTLALPPGGRVPGLNPLMSVDQWLSEISVQIDGSRAAGEEFVIVIKLSDQGQTWRLTLSNGALTYRVVPDDTLFSSGAGLHLTVTKEEMGQLLLAKLKPEGKVSKGDPNLVNKLLQFLPWANSLESRL
jgi:alkyl sulfatase BDS1-like metallo-beta-lactamase superfamily hydrolase